MFDFHTGPVTAVSASAFRAAARGFAWAVWLAWVPGSLEAAEMRELKELREAAADRGRGIADFRIEGTVCAISSSRRLLVLQQGAHAELLEVPPLTPGIGAGQRLIMEGERCAITRGRFALQLGTAPVVDADGHHSVLTRSGPVFLKEGLQPLCVEWFNGFSNTALELAFEGPGIPRQKVPAGLFFHRAEGVESFDPGLRYQSYLGSGWTALPDFTELPVAARGIVPDFDVSVRPRPEDSGIVFSGVMKVEETGIYQFHLTSDDGARVFIGQPQVSCTLLPGSVPVKTSPWESRAVASWVAAEGTVTFAARKGRLVELDVAGQEEPFHVTVLDDGVLDAAALLHDRVKVRGLARTEGVLVPDARHLERLPRSHDGAGTITRVGEVRRLQPAEASRPYPVKLRGVVTMAAAGFLVIQDLTGGVYVQYASPAPTVPPRPGELWEIEGRTDPGDFSPMILAEHATRLGSAPLPEAVRPTWDQLSSGSLDAEQVEIEGVVVSTAADDMVLLTRDGRIRIFGNRFYPLPFDGMSAAAREALPGSVVRVRGVFTANWDGDTGRVNPGVFLLGNAMLAVDEPPPRDPFAALALPASDLMLFTSHASAFKRVKVSGVVVHARPPELFLSDASHGFRVVSRDAMGLQPGDRVEAAGFPRLGGPSPVLLEARVRKTGQAALPDPAFVSADGLTDARLDSTRVKIDAILLSDTLRQEERVLEVQAGAHRFTARLAAARPAAKAIERGSLLQLAGTYATSPADRPVAGSEPFEILLNTAADLVILQRGPWWTVRHTYAAVGILSGGLLMALIWVTLLRRTVALRGKQLAVEIEQRQQVERHRAMEQERTRVAQDLHDELGSGLTEVGILTSLVKNPDIPQPRKEDYLDQLEDVCGTLVTGLDEIVWAVNPRYDSVTDLAGYFSLFAQRFLGLAGINCRLHIDDSVAEHPLDSSRRHGLFLAFKEALNNIARHSQAGEVRLAITVADGRLKVLLNDDGRGFDAPSSSPGSDGLHGMKKRLQQLGGTCRITSGDGAGTTVEFSLPLEPLHA